MGIHGSRMDCFQNDFRRSCWDIEEKKSVEYYLCHCTALSAIHYSFLGNFFLTELSSVDIVF